MSDPTPPATERTSPMLAVSESTGLPANIAAALSCIFTLVGGVVFLVLERKDRFVRFYSMQSIILGTVALLVWISVEVVDFIFRHIPLIGGLLHWLLYALNSVFSLVWIAVYLIVIVQAFRGKEWQIPYLGKLARRQST
ncbi:MAG: DUF4870 domain-containing protein [Chthoniobacteraceae bacterium]